MLNARPVSRRGTLLLLAVSVLALISALPQGEARAAEDSLRVVIQRLTVRPLSWAFYDARLRIQGTLAPADGTPPEELNLPGEDLLLTVGNVLGPYSFQIPAFDPGWQLRRGFWTWLPNKYGDPKMRFRYDPESGAFDLLIPRLGIDAIGVQPFGQNAPLIAFHVALGDSLSGRSYTVITKRGSRLYSHRPSDDPIQALEPGDLPVESETSDQGSYGGRLFRLEVPTAGRYTIEAILGTLSDARLRVWSAENAADLGDSWLEEPVLLLDLLPGTYIVHVEPWGRAGTFALAVSAPAEPEVLLVNAAPVQATLWSSQSRVRLFAFDAQESGTFSIEVHGLPHIWDAPFILAVSIFNLADGMSLLANTSGSDLEVNLSLPPGRYIIAASVSPTDTWGTGTFTVAVSK